MTLGNGWLGIGLSCEGCDVPASDTAIHRAVLVVRDVAPKGRFQPAPGDTIIAVNRTITDPRRMRQVLRETPKDGEVTLALSGAKGRYVIEMRKEAVRRVSIGRDTLPLKYRASFNKTSIEVLTNGTPLLRRDSQGELIITIDKHVVRLKAEDIRYRVTTIERKAQ